MLASAIFASLDGVLSKPLSIFSLLGQTIPGVGSFFVSYVLLQAFGKFPGELARVGPLLMTTLKLRSPSITIDTERMKVLEPGSIDYGKLLPQQLVIYLICLAVCLRSCCIVLLPRYRGTPDCSGCLWQYAVLQPIISLFGVMYFAMG